MEDLLHVQWMQNIELLPIILGSPGSQQFHLFRLAQMMCLKTACNFSHKIHWHLHTRRSQMLAGCLPSSTLTMSSQAGPQWTGWVLLYFDFGEGVRMCLFVCVCVLVVPGCNFIKPIFYLPNQGSMWSLPEVSKSEILAFISHCFSNVEKLIKGKLVKIMPRGKSSARKPTNPPL